MEKNNGRLQIAAAAVAVLCLMFGAGAYAADENPCSRDMDVFCKGIEPGTNAMMDCLEKHEGELSTDCRSYEAKMGGSRVEMKETVRNISESNRACRDDVAKFCMGANPEQDGIAKCLKENESKISSACVQSIREKSKE